MFHVYTTIFYNSLTPRDWISIRLLIDYTIVEICWPQDTSKIKFVCLNKRDALINMIYDHK